MNKKPLVSVIIAHHNGRNLIKGCLDSLFKIDYPKDRLEIIVVDNCSEDGSVKFIKSKYPKVKIIANNVNNYCKACNLGILTAKGSYIVLLNNDVKVRKKWLSELVKVIEKDKSIGAVTCKLIGKNRTIQNVGHYELPNFYWDELGSGRKANEYDRISEVDSISGACVLYRKIALDKIGLLDEDFIMFGEDVDMSIRLKEQGWKLVYVNSSIAFHIIHGSCSENFAREAIEKNRLLLIAKHYPFKLANSLIGSGYFVASEDKFESGRIFDILPSVLLKLAKHHNKEVLDRVIPEVLAELKRILNYENKKLQENIKNILADLIETRKNRDHYKADTQGSQEIITEKEKHIEELLKRFNNLQEELAHYKEEINNLQRELNRHREDVTTLMNKLQESLYSGLDKDSNLLEKENQIQQVHSQLNNLQQELFHHKDEVITLTHKLQESLDSGLSKDSNLLERQQHIEDLSRQLSELHQQLNNLQQELVHYKEETSTLTHKLQESLDSGLSKDSSLLEKENQIEKLSEQLHILQKELTDHKEEISGLTDKLKESLDSGLIKDSVIADKTRQLENLENKLSQVEKELSSIYQSEGFRYVLNPLWKIIWYPKLFLRFLLKHINNILWIAAILVLSPVMLLQVLFFSFERFAEVLFGWASVYFKKERKVVPFNELSISVVIPNWNGIDLLRQCLASIYEIDEFREGKYEVLVVDDASKYNIAKCIKDDFPKVRVIRNIFNKGFGRTSNRGVKNAKGELIVLLNNDIMVSKDFLEPLREHFKEEDVFAVAPKLYYWDKKTFNYGMHMGRFEEGYLSLWNEAETGNGDKVSQTAPTIFAVGGAKVFRKKDFLWLGGFDDIYRPNCWEDIDISYRAQKRGLKVLYEPKSIVYHKGASTLNYIRHKEIKNELLFMWKNLTDTRMLLNHLNHLPKFFYYGRHSSRLTFLLGYLWAMDYIILAFCHRFDERKYIKVSDKKILNRCMLYYRNFKRNNYVHTEKKTILLITPFMLYPLTSGGKLRIYNLYKRLVSKYDLILLSLIHNEDERRYVDQLKDIFKEVHLIHPKTPSNEFLFPRLYKYSFSEFFIEELKTIQEKAPIDIVHIESNELLYLTKYIKYTPIVYTEHDVSILSFFNSYYKKSPRNPFSGFLDYLKIVRYHNLVYASIDKVITLSKRDYRTVKAFSAFSDVSLIPTGVDLGHFTFSKKSGKNKNLIFIGHYPHYPNEEAAVYFAKHIFPLIKSGIPGVRLKLVGSEPTEAVIKLGQLEGIDVIGTVTDVNPHLQDASVFVNAFQRSAGIKGKVLEAMATGTPVVCTTLGASGIEAVNGQSILIADNPTNFARYVIELLKNDELYYSIADNARRLVEQKYDWDNIAKQLDQVCQNITGVATSGIDKEIKSPQVSHETKTVLPAPGQESMPFLTSRVSAEAIIEQVDKIVGLSLDYRAKDNTLSATAKNPEELHIELTHLCNSKCIMCDIWDYHQRNNKSINDELSFEDIKKLIKKSEHLKGIKTVVLSGGEPFLRSELVDICSLIGEVFPQAAVGILTNATNTETVISKTKAILATSKVNSLWLGSSLDGIGPMYDKIRSLSGGFERFVKTIQRLKRELPTVNLSATFVLTPFNLDQLLPCWEFSENHGLDFFAQFAVPKQARSPEVFQWQEEDFRKISEYIKQIIGKIIAKDQDPEAFYKSLSTISDKINLLTKIYYWAHLVDFQRTGKGFSHNCNAAFKFAMFDAYGNMFFCPLLKEKTIGNIKERDFDQMWSSSEANNIREFIGSGKCSCWLICTVFPIVSEALSLYGDKAAASLFLEQNRNKTEIQAQSEIRQASDMHMDRVDNFLDRKDLLSSISQDFWPNIDLNNEEYREKRSVLQSTPQGITIGTNYGCNADCIFCLGGEYKPFSLSLYKDYFEPKLGFMLKHCGYISLCGIGELLLVPEIEKFLNYINEKLPDKNKVLTTNGLALNNKILDRIIKSKYSLQISLHASNPVLHEYLTGIKGGFDKIIQQIRLIVANRKDKQSPYITLVFVVNTMNIEDLPSFVELAASLGVDSIQCNYLTIFKPSHLKLSCFFRQEVTNQMFDIATQKANELKISLVLPPRFCADKYFKSICSDPWKNIYLDTEGAVLPCCYSGDHFGELAKEDILSIWNNDKFKRIRLDLASGNPLAMCKYCLNNRQDNVNILNAHVSFRPEVQKAILEQN